MYSTRKSLERLVQIYKREVRRQISKTTSVTNSDAMAPRLDLPVLSEENVLPKKLLQLKKYHRSVICKSQRKRALHFRVQLPTNLRLCNFLVNILSNHATYAMHNTSR